MKHKYTIFVIFLISILTVNIYSNSKGVRNYSKGPLFGKNFYIPYLIYYNFPSLSAKEGRRYDFGYHLSLYYTNDFKNLLYKNSNNEIFCAEVIRDYESCVIELGVDYYILKNLQIGFDTRIISYYGGFLDTIVENYHHAFNFPNGGREYTPRDQLYINIQNNNNVSLFLDKSTVSFGDIDTWLKYSFYNNRWISLALIGAFKIPAGQLCCLSGSGYPDFGFQILTDIRPFWLFTFYFQAGMVLPIDSIIPGIPSKPYPMFNGLAGVELNPIKLFSLIVQLNIKTSSMSSNIIHRSDYLGNYDYLSLPQINLLAGFIFKHKDFKWQFYFEEDAFTNAGTDFTINLMFSQRIKMDRGM